MGLFFHCVILAPGLLASGTRGGISNLPTHIPPLSGMQRPCTLTRKGPWQRRQPRCPLPSPPSSAATSGQPQLPPWTRLNEALLEPITGSTPGETERERPVRNQNTVALVVGKKSQDSRAHLLVCINLHPRLSCSFPSSALPDASSPIRLS